MFEKLLSYDDFTGIRSVFRHDPYTGKSQIVSTQDVEVDLDFNKTKQNDGTEGWVSRKKEWRHAAHIPFGVLEMWRVVDGIDWRKKEDLPRIMAKLDDIEFRHLRTALFRLGKHRV